MGAHEMLHHLHKLFEEHGRNQRYEISKSVFRTKKAKVAEKKEPMKAKG